MALLGHPNGRCLVRVGLGGTAGPLYDLGYTRDGVRMNLQQITAEVMSDNAGLIPADIQRFGVVANLSMPMQYFDWDVMDDVFSTAFGAALGAEPEPGQLIAFGGLTRRFVLTSVLDGVPWRFFHCIWKDAGKLLAARCDPLTINVYAWPAPQGNPLSVSSIYDHVNA